MGPLIPHIISPAAFAPFVVILIFLVVLSFETSSVLSRPIFTPAGKEVAELKEAEITPFSFLQHLMMSSSSHKGRRSTSSTITSLKGIRQLKQYFHRFGYMQNHETNAGGSSAGVVDEEYYHVDTFDQVLLESALVSYQQNYNLQVTGILDPPTVQQMMKQRCGVPDIVNGTSSMQLHSFFRNRRWPASKTHLTYGFLPAGGGNYYQLLYTTSIKISIDRDALSRVCRRAFARWSAVTHFTFEEAKVEDYDSADIKIGFFRGAHGDGADFDGRGGVLAHAFAPTAGIFHLDADENWSTTATQLGANETDLESVAVHEIGHLLGLGHTSVRDAVMYPTIPRGVKKVKLHEDDIAGIRALYNI